LCKYTLLLFILSVPLILLILINTSVSVYANVIKGKNSDDILTGTNKNDTIRGYNGNDIISGLKGNDQLFGNNGSDTLIGGIGADKFDCGWGIDNVIDFNSSDGDTLSKNCEVNTKTDNNKTKQPAFGSELGPSILVKTDKAVYGSGDTIKIDGQVNEKSRSNISKSLISPINIKISRIAEEKATPVKDVSMLPDSEGNYHLDFIPFEDGKYLINVTIANNASLSKFSQFEVKSIFDTTTTDMLKWAGICFSILLIVIIYGSHVSNTIYDDSEKKKIGLDEAWRRAQFRVTIVECLRLLLITGMAIFFTLSLLFADTEIGVDSPIGLVKKNGTGTVFSQKTTTITQNGTQWVFNVGGTNADNYIAGIQIPTFIVIFGLLGGYFRFLYGMRFLFSEKRRKEQFYNTDKRWGDVNVMDPLSFLKHSLRSLSLFFLSPFVAVGVWLIFVQIGTTGVWVAAAGSFTMGLITEEVILTLISFARTVLVGIRESSFFSSSVTQEDKDKEKPKAYRTTPNDKSTGVSPNQQVSIEYDEVISKDSAINNFKLSENGTKVVGDAKFAEPRSIIFTPNNPLSPDKTYTAEIASGIFDLHQNQAEPVTWTFTTRKLPILENKVPQSDELVPHGKIKIEATFNQIVNFNNDSIKVERIPRGQPAVEILGTTRGKPDDKRSIFFELQRGHTFDAGNRYRITLSNIRDSDDNDLQQKDGWTWEFDAT
jgi:Bacterial Ig-like domain/RTX calcium-binding nonapeptide repeat (4 copies)